MTAEEQKWPRGARLVEVPVSRITGDLTLCNYRLAPVIKGKVSCLHVETLEPAECSFSADSGCLVESECGLYAPVGQLISRDGDPNCKDSEYIVAAKVSEELTVPSIHPRYMPDASPSCELLGGAIRETGSTATNANATPLRHYCRYQVCSADQLHPDDADLVGSAAGPIYCYVGRGAAFNNIHGHEADERDVYYAGVNYIHTVWNSGFEVPASKRPATAGWPPRVMPSTPILWRAVQPRIKIGSELRASGGCP